MVRLLNESDDSPRPLAGAGSRQIDGRARGEYGAYGIASGYARSGWRSIHRPIRPIPPLGRHDVARGVDDFGRFDRQAWRSRRQTAFARGDVMRKQGGLVRFEHVQRRSGPWIDLYEPDRIGGYQKISAVETDEIKFGSNRSDGTGDLFRLRWVDVDGSGCAAISKPRRGGWRRPLYAETDDFSSLLARQE